MLEEIVCIIIACIIAGILNGCTISTNTGCYTLGSVSQLEECNSGSLRMGRAK